MSYRKFTLMSLLAMTLSVKAYPQSVSPSVEKINFKDQKAIQKSIKKECIAHAKTLHLGDKLHIKILKQRGLDFMTKSYVKKLKKDSKQQLKEMTRMCRDNFNNNLKRIKNQK